MRRVVVTGLGAITPLGLGIRQVWSRLIAGECGIVSVAHLEPSHRWRGLPATIAGLVPQGDGGDKSRWNTSDWLAKGEERRMAKFAQYAIAATEMAFQDARWKPQNQEDKENTGICLGSGIGNLEELYDTSLAFNADVSNVLGVRTYIAEYQVRDTRKFRRSSCQNY